MKENRPLLIVIGVMLAVVLAILLPDYFGCHRIHLYKSSADHRIESLELQDVRHFVRVPIRSIAVDDNALTIVVDRANPSYNPQLITFIAESWEQSYALRHKDFDPSKSCLLLTVTDLDGRTISLCESHDSVTRLAENACEF
jgi:hypothetical protein